MTEPLDLDAIQARTDAAIDPSACGTCRILTADGKPTEHPECARRATLIPAPDAPCYETILDTSEDQRSNLPARFHTPVWDGNGQPNGWHCAVCWGDSWSTRWPCVTAATYGADVFTPEHLAERARTDELHAAIAAHRDESRAVGMREAAAMLRRYCPTHGYLYDGPDTSSMDCHCEGADEIDRDARAAAPSAPTT